MVTLELLLMSSPFVFAVMSLYFFSKEADKYIMTIGAACHLALTLSLNHGKVAAGVLFGADDLSYLFLLILSVLFLGTSLYNLGFLTRIEKSFNFLYTPSTFAFLSFMTGVILSRRLGLMWLFTEAAVVAAAPLIAHQKSKESLGTLWKYLFICSVSIAMAFIGVVAMAEASKGVVTGGLDIGTLAMNSFHLSQLWGGVAIIFITLGYGSVMGLLPVHSWLPDAHVHAPSPASALFSGTLINCAFLSILRYYQIFASTPLISFFKTALIALGLISIFVSAAYVLASGNFKRKLASSSIGHMGILAAGMGFGGSAIYGVMLYTLCHSLAKSLMFLTAGNFLHSFGTVEVSKIRNAINTIPLSSWLLLSGVLVLAGFPPSGTFLSLFIMSKQMLAAGNWPVFTVFASLLCVITYAMVRDTVEMVFSPGVSVSGERSGESVFLVMTQGLFIIALIALGVSIPGKINELIIRAASTLGGSF